ncbi:hypothetical protein DL768_005458 [Monosporascus sp. mg162]|nr:hypothetical protein DL768_005458 [Monosporascus sp. mg162]
MDPDAELAQGDKVETDNTTAPTGAAFVETQEEGIHVDTFLSDGYGSVFHPQILLHEIFANLAIRNMINHNQEKNDLPTCPEVLSLDSCPLTTSEPPLPALSPTSTKKPTSISTAPAMGEVGCFGRNQRPLRPGGPVNPDSFEKAADKACHGFAVQVVKTPGELENRSLYVYKTRDGDIPLQFSIDWGQDYTLPVNAVQQQNMR